MRTIRIAGAALLAVIAAACVPRAAPPAPVPTPPPAPVPMPPPEAPPPAPPPIDWMQAEPTPGDWRFGEETGRPRATFAAGRLSLTLSCERSGVILIGLHGLQSQPEPGFVIETTFGERRLPTTPAPMNEMRATLPASDPLLDQMAFSRGRVLIGADGGPVLIVPAWPEIARVTEECRGA
jgi:hypothetical protein